MFNDELLATCKKELILWLLQLVLENVVVKMK